MAKLTEDERLFRKIEDKIPWPWWIYWGAGRKSIVLGLRSW